MSLITNAATSGKPQVFDLLDDLFEFQQSCPKEGLFYCLQPLVVCQKKNLSFEGVHIEQLVHLGSSWWYRYGCAKKFEDLLNKYWINR